MEYRKLGRSDIEVSALCLGTMTWGEQNTEAQGHAQMDYAVDQGINFFDTAEYYSIPPKRETTGSTERIIGTWFASRKARDKVILATKVVGRTDIDWFRNAGGPARLTRAQIFEAVDGSLARLQTDYIDLYQVHWPDRPMRLFGGCGFQPGEGDAVPISETLDALSDLVKAGKVREIGISNETPWGTMSYLRHGESNGGARVQTIQNAYNLLNRTFEMGLSEITLHEQVGLLPYSPLGQGHLTGKYQNGALPKGARKTLFGRMERYETPGADKAIDRYLDLARRHGLDPAQMAVQFVTTRAFVSSNIIGATTMEQLKTNIASVNVTLSQEVLDGIEQIHLQHPNPCP